MLLSCLGGFFDAEFFIFPFLEQVYINGLLNHFLELLQRASLLYRSFQEVDKKVLDYCDLSVDRFVAIFLNKDLSLFHADLDELSENFEFYCQ